MITGATRYLNYYQLEGAKIGSTILSSWHLQLTTGIIVDDARIPSSEGMIT